MLLWLAGCAPTAEERAAIVAVAAQVSMWPSGRLDGAEGEVVAYEDTVRDELARASLEGEVTWGGDPEGACAVSGECVSSERTFTARGRVRVKRGGWEDELTSLEPDGEIGEQIDGVVGRPSSDLPNTTVEVDLTGWVQSAPGLYDYPEFDAFGGAEVSGEVSFRGEPPTPVEVELDWGYGSDTWRVTLDGETWLWWCQRST